MPKEAQKTGPTLHQAATEGFIGVPGGKVYFRAFPAKRPGKPGGLPLLALHGGPGGPNGGVRRRRPPPPPGMRRSFLGNTAPLPRGTRPIPKNLLTFRCRVW